MYYPIPSFTFRPKLSQVLNLIRKGTIIYAYGPDENEGRPMGRVRHKNGKMYYVDPYHVDSITYDPTKPRNKLTIETTYFFGNRKKVFRSLNNVFLVNDRRIDDVSQSKTEGRKCNDIPWMTACQKRKDCIYVNGDDRGFYKYCRSKRKSKRTTKTK